MSFREIIAAAALVATGTLAQGASNAAIEGEFAVAAKICSQSPRPEVAKVFCDQVQSMTLAGEEAVAAAGPKVAEAARAVKTKQDECTKLEAATLLEKKGGARLQSCRADIQRAQEDAEVMRHMLIDENRRYIIVNVADLVDHSKELIALLQAPPVKSGGNTATAIPYNGSLTTYSFGQAVLATSAPTKSVVTFQTQPLTSKDQQVRLVAAIHNQHLHAKRPVLVQVAKHQGPQLNPMIVANSDAPPQAPQRTEPNFLSALAKLIGLTNN
jgi:hypothetical protein